MFERFELVDTLEYVQFPEEILFDTLVAEANITSTNKYLRFIDWRKCGAHPRTFNENYYNDIINRKCDFWARKFSIIESSKVLNMIDEHIKKIDQLAFENECSK